MQNLNKEACCCCLNNLWDVDKYKLLEVCKVCGMGRAKDMPNEEALREYYQKDYFFGDEYVDYIKDRKALEKNFSKRINTLINLVGTKRNIKVCEIGSAYGFFLNLIKPFSSKTIGFEMGKDGVDYANKNFAVNTFDKDFLKTEIDKGQDLCVMWDVIEHLRYPDKYVEKSATLLAKNGIFALTTGDIGSFLARRKLDGWRMIHPPTHLYYFTKKSLEILLERNGLEPVYAEYPPHYRNLGSVIGMIGLDRDRKGKSSAIIKPIEYIANKTGLHRINFGVNTRDIVFIAGRKK